MTSSPPVVGVLDDEPEMRKALRRLLTGRGYRVQEYACGNDLLEGVATRDLDCLLLDLHMPGMNGFEVLQSLRSHGAHPPVIVITAHDKPGTADRVRSLGASAYLRKPVDREELFSAIDTVTTHPSAKR